MKKSILTISIAIILSTSALSFAETKKCSGTNLNCSCDEVKTIIKAGLNGNPFEIQKKEIEEIKIGDGCRASISKKIDKGVVKTASIVNGSNGNTNPFNSKLNTVVSKSLTSSSSGKNVCKPKAEMINGISRVDVRKLEDQKCNVYLPNQYPASTSDKTLSPYKASFLAYTLLKQKTDMPLVKKILDDFIYEVENYGYPIAGNKGYQLTSTQNNIIPTLFLLYFEATKNYGWLENKAVPATINIIEYLDNRLGVIGLNGTKKDDEKEESFEGNRWFSNGVGPEFNIWDNNKAYYYTNLFRLVKLASTTDPKRPNYAQGFDYNRIINVLPNQKIDLYNEKNALRQVNIDNLDKEIAEVLIGKTFILDKKMTITEKDEPVIQIDNVYYSFTPKYFANDRAANVSMYNPSNLFGPYNAFVDEFVDVALNAINFRSKKDLAKMYSELAKYYDGRDEKTAKTYREKVELYDSEAANQKTTIFKYLWSNTEDALLNYSHHMHTLRTSYPFLSSGYALWADLFVVSDETERKKLDKMISYIINTFEGPDGLYVSNVENGLKWGKPFVSPIQQAIVVDGIDGYAKSYAKKEKTELKKIADRISLKYLFGSKDENTLEALASKNYIHSLLSEEGKTLYNKLAKLQ